MRLLTGIVLGSDNEAFQRDACGLLDFAGGDEELGPAIEERLQVAAAVVACCFVVTACTSDCRDLKGANQGACCCSTVPLPLCH